MSKSRTSKKDLSIDENDKKKNKKNSLKGGIISIDDLKGSKKEWVMEDTNNKILYKFDYSCTVSPKGYTALQLTHAWQLSVKKQNDSTYRKSTFEDFKALLALNCQEPTIQKQLLAIFHDLASNCNQKILYADSTGKETIYLPFAQTGCSCQMQVQQNAFTITASGTLGLVASPLSYNKGGDDTFDKYLTKEVKNAFDEEVKVMCIASQRGTILLVPCKPNTENFYDFFVEDSNLLTHQKAYLFAMDHLFNSFYKEVNITPTNFYFHDKGGHSKTVFRMHGRVLPKPSSPKKEILYFASDGKTIKKKFK